MTDQVALVVRSFSFDDNGMCRINPPLYGDDKAHFIRETHGLLSVEGLYGVHEATILEAEPVVRKKLIKLGYIEWDEGTHSYLFNGYRINIDAVLARTMHFIRNHNVRMPETISVRRTGVVLEYDDEGGTIIEGELLNEYWDFTCS